MRKALFSLAVAIPALLLAANASANTLRCGDAVDQDVVLQADLHCTDGESALRVTTSGVRIDLNGFTLSGSADMDGIDVIGARDVSIVGPGQISGFRAGVYAVRTRSLAIDSIDFSSLDTGALLIHSAAVDVRNSSFRQIGGIAVNVMQPQMGPLNSVGGHYLLDNQFTAVGSGIQLCGIDTGHALIQRNEFRQVRDFGVQLADGSSGNRILDNRFDGVMQSAIEMQGSSRNSVHDNRIANGRFGISLSPRAAGLCETGGGLPQVFANRIENNEFSGLERGVRAGIGSRAEGPAWHNQISANAFNGNQGDILLLGDSVDNAVFDNRLSASQGGIDDYSWRASQYVRPDYGYFSRH